MSFDDLFNSLQPALQSIEAQRKDINTAVKQKTKKAAVVLGAISILATIAVYLQTEIFPAAFGAGFTIMVVGYLVAAEIFKSKAKKVGIKALDQRFQHDILPKLLSSFNHKMEILKKPALDREKLLESNLLYIKKNSDTYVGTEITGKIDDRDFSLAVVETVAYQKSNEQGSGSLNLDRKPARNRSRQNFS
ncbi:MAG: hypothetical protein AAF789_15120, partial [Bacteroidota bacterium]